MVWGDRLGGLLNGNASCAPLLSILYWVHWFISIDDPGISDFTAIAGLDITLLPKFIAVHNPASREQRQVVTDVVGNYNDRR